MTYNKTNNGFNGDEKIKELKEKIKNVSLEEMKHFCDSWKVGYFVGLHKYSFFNYCMANMQLVEQGKPMSVIAPFKVWSDKGFHVKKGEKAVHVFAPIIKTEKSEVKTETGETETKENKKIKGFRLVPVFDIGQTDGDISKLEMNKGGLIGDWVLGNSKIDFNSLKNLFDIPVKIYPISNNTENGYTDGVTISLLEKSDNEMIATYIHELAHFNLHFSKNDDYEKLSRDAKEVEAESVSFLVCSAIGLENTKAPLYIKGWGDFKDDIRI